MSEAYVTTDAVRYVQVDDLAAPVTGATVTYTLLDPSGTTVRTAVAATEVGSTGLYTYTVDGPTYLLTPGLYRELWHVSKSGLEKDYWSYLLVLYPQGPVVRRWELRHKLARMLGDLRLGVSTGSNTSTTLKDTGVVEGDNDWRGAWLAVYAGTSRGDERQVTSFTQTGGIFTAGTAWTSTPDTTSRYEVHRRWSVADYNSAINDAVQEAANEYLLPITDESVTVTDTQDYEYAIPAPFYAVSEVWWEETSQSAPVWQRLSNQKQQWRVLTGRGILRLPAPPSTTTRLRLLGQAQPTALGFDDDVVTVPADYLRYKAAALLLAGQVHSAPNDPDATLSLYDRYQQAAEGLLSRLRRPLRGTRV